MRPAALTIASMLTATSAWAQEEPTLLEYPEGPIVNSNRVMGMGGAYVGVAEGADGHLYNPASFAYRYPFSRNQFVDWDWTLYRLNLPGKRNPDLYGGQSETRSANWAGLGLDLKIGGWGFGLHFHTKDYVLETDDVTSPRIVSNSSIGFGLAYAMQRLDLTFGSYVYGFVWSALGQNAEGAEEEILNMVAAGARLGVLWRPENRPVRVGIVYRSPFRATDVEASDQTRFEAPDGIVRPPELSIGGSFMIGKRVYNPSQTWGLNRMKNKLGPQPTDERHRYLTISYDVLIQGIPPPGTVSMRGYFVDRDEPIPIKQDTATAFRAGLESEVWVNWLVLRSGYYFEPSRTAVISGRHHGTAGFAFRLPVGKLVGFWPWDLRLDAAFDVARNYINTGIGLGIWH